MATGTAGLLSPAGAPSSRAAQLTMAAGECGVGAVVAEDDGTVRYGSRPGAPWARFLDPRLVVHPSTPMGMPLVWFGLCDDPVAVPPLEPAGPAGVGPAATAWWRPTWTPAGHAHGVREVQERVAAGDTFQCNLTVRMSGRVPGDPSLLYRDLALGQRGASSGLGSPVPAAPAGGAG